MGSRASRAIAPDVRCYERSPRFPPFHNGCEPRARSVGAARTCRLQAHTFWSVRKIRRVVEVAFDITMLGDTTVTFASDAMSTIA